ncbi:MAG: hypothetical protein GXW99_02040 [Clostridiales bacterium]|nr:hypothetical protein [Clostridiales bacterium]
MPNKAMPGPIDSAGSACESVCIHTRKIFDSCRDKDCVEDLRFYPTLCGQEVLNTSQSIKGGTAELLYVYTDVEPVTFNRGFYTIDMRFFYRVILQVYTGSPRCAEAEGLCVFDKRCILFGSEGNAKIFSSDTIIDDMDIPGRVRSNLPIAVVEAVDPIVLDTKVVDCCQKHCCDCCITEIPPFIAQIFPEELVFNDACPRRYYVTLGQFSLVRLERETQLLIPVYDYCIPQSECTGGGDQESPCDLFRNVNFPISEFFPPNTMEMPKDYVSTRNYCSTH